MSTLDSLLNKIQTYNSPYEALKNTKIGSKDFFVGCGSGRLVVNLDEGATEGVYKIAIGSSGFRQNYVENFVWNLLIERGGYSEATQIAAPVLSTVPTYRYIEMVSVNVIEEVIGTGVKELKLKSQFHDYGIVVEDLGIGEYKGYDVAFDYGRLKKIETEFKNQKQ